MVTFMLARENLLISFWGDALLTIAHILYRALIKYVETTLYELSTRRKLELDYLRA